ncbi:MAG: tRNA lysidine(34) synthetase TilS [Elusimicrobia bacterium]|nr:tRNA lysidine(34) synthetase TilS [Elusimicrobiota bacterium]
MSHRKSFTLKIWDRLLKHLKKFSLFKNNDSIILAVSGGPDSVFMLDFFAKQARKKGLKLLICHLNHGIRGKKADRDEEFVKKLARIYGIEFAAKKINAPELAKKNKTSLEHASRQARYGFLLKTAKTKGFGLIATAHHSDDNIETILLNLMRGTEPRGLRGIPVKRILWRKGAKRIAVIRPAICATKKEILEYLRLNGLAYRKDSTNEDEKHLRNWIRKTLIPLIEKKQPKFREHLLDLSSKMQNLVY